MKKYLLPVVLLLVNCQTLPTPPSPEPPPEPIPEDTSTCVAAGRNIAKICPELATTPGGKSFEQFCKDKVQQNIPMNPSCIAKAHNCQEANTCIGSN